MKSLQAGAPAGHNLQGAGPHLQAQGLGTAFFKRSSHSEAFFTAADAGAALGWGCAGGCAAG